MGKGARLRLFSELLTRPGLEPRASESGAFPAMPHGLLAPAHVTWVELHVLAQASVYIPFMRAPGIARY